MSDLSEKLAVIPEAAVTAAYDALDEDTQLYMDWGNMKAALEAALPIIQADAALTHWKLDALKEWSDAMIEESSSPQSGRDVQAILEVGSMDEAREIDAP